MKHSSQTVLIGLGATAMVDVFTFILSQFTHKSHGIQYIGRWSAYLFRGELCHDTIADAPSLAHEMLLGWVVHYAVGVVFAFCLVGLFGKRWLAEPALPPALVVGSTTLFFPICILQPAMGFGIAFSKVPHGGFLLLKIIAIHAVYGVGLYLLAKGMRFLRYPYRKHQSKSNKP